MTWPDPEFGGQSAIDVAQKATTLGHNSTTMLPLNFHFSIPFAILHAFLSYDRTVVRFQFGESIDVVACVKVGSCASLVSNT